MMINKSSLYLMSLNKKNPSINFNWIKSQKVVFENESPKYQPCKEFNGAYYFYQEQEGLNDFFEELKRKTEDWEYFGDLLMLKNGGYVVYAISYYKK